MTNYNNGKTYKIVNNIDNMIYIWNIIWQYNGKI